MDALAAGHDAAVQMIDTSVVRVHQHGACTLTSFVSLTRARGRERGLAVVTGSLAHAIGRAKTAGGQFTCFVSLTRARGRERGLAVVTGWLATRSVAPKRQGSNLPVLSALHAREGESVVWPLLR